MLTHRIAPPGVEVHHKAECPGPEMVTTRGQRGDLILRCRACHRFKILPTEPEHVPVPDSAGLHDVSPVPERVATMARYVCADHGEPVTWRGDGCRGCADDQRKRLRVSREARRVR